MKLTASQESYLLVFLQIANHVENNCPKSEVPCPYVWIGCNSEVTTVNEVIFKMLFATLCQSPPVARAHIYCDLLLSKNRVITIQMLQPKKLTTQMEF